MGSSFREIGQVTEIDGVMAKVTIKRRSSCENCGACGMGTRPEMVLTLKNTIGAAVGEPVVIEMRSKALYKAAFFMYIIPLVNLIIGYLIGRRIGTIWGAKPSGAENFGILAGFIFMALSYLFINWLDRSKRLSSKVEPQLVEVLRGEESS